jgi:hypothetical protein
MDNVTPNSYYPTSKITRSTRPRWTFQYKYPGHADLRPAATVQGRIPCVWSTRDDSESVWIYDSHTGLGSHVNVRLNPQGGHAGGDRGVLAPAPRPDWDILLRNTWTYPGHHDSGSGAGNDLHRWRWNARAYGLLCTNRDDTHTGPRETDLRAARAVHRQRTAQS